MCYWRENFQVTERKGAALSLCRSIQPRLCSLSLLGAPLGAFGVENALFEPQPAVLSWECLAQPHHCSKAIREHHVQNCLQRQKRFCLSQGALGVCWLVCLCCRGILCFCCLLFLLSWEHLRRKEVGTQLALVESGSMYKEEK